MDAESSGAGGATCPTLLPQALTQPRVWQGCRSLPKRPAGLLWEGVGSVHRSREAQHAGPARPGQLRGEIMQGESPWSCRARDCDQPAGWAQASGDRGGPGRGRSQQREALRVGRRVQRLSGRGARDEDPGLTQEVEAATPCDTEATCPSPAVTLTTATSGDVLSRLPTSPAREQPCPEWPRGATPPEGRAGLRPRHLQL